MELTDLHKQILLLGTSDWIGLSNIIFRIYGGPYSREQLPKVVRDKTLSTVRDLMKSGLVEAGFPSSDGNSFNSWNLSTEETLTRIENEWDKLEHPPTIGDVAWFNLTPAGQQVAEEIEKQSSNKSQV